MIGIKDQVVEYPTQLSAIEDKKFQFPNDDKIYIILDDTFSLQGLNKIEMRSQKKNSLGRAEFFKAFWQGFGLTVINPLALFGFLGLFVALGISRESTEVSVFSKVAWVSVGCFAGAMLWWTSLSLMSRWLRKKLKNELVDRLLMATNFLIFFSSFLFLGRIIFRS